MTEKKHYQIIAFVLIFSLGMILGFFINAESWVFASDYCYLEHIGASPKCLECVRNMTIEGLPTMRCKEWC